MDAQISGLVFAYNLHITPYTFFISDHLNTNLIKCKCYTIVIMQYCLWNNGKGKSEYAQHICIVNSSRLCRWFSRILCSCPSSMRTWIQTPSTHYTHKELGLVACGVLVISALGSRVRQFLRTWWLVSLANTKQTNQWASSSLKYTLSKQSCRQEEAIQPHSLYMFMHR